ncbi:hypothetical protein PTKIN_Ptkin11bG0201100 [Pterospermum kingtungense]
MCLQEEAQVHPFISDVVTTLNFVGNGLDPTIDPSSFPSLESDNKQGYVNREVSKKECERAVSEAIEWASTSRLISEQTHSTML